MSVQALSCAMVVRGVTASEKLLLLVLANYADEHMTCWPSHKRMAADACLSERTILTLLKGLEVSHFISRRERSRSDGSRTTDAITLHFSGEVVSPHPEICGEGVGKSTAPGGAEISPLTTFDPSSEPSIDEPVVVALRAPPTTVRGSRFCPTAWKPSEETFLTLGSEGHTAGDLERALTRMRDYEFPKPRTDWDKCFRTWVRRDADRKPKPHERHHPDAKLTAKQDNYARAWTGSERAVGRDWEP